VSLRAKEGGEGIGKDINGGSRRGKSRFRKGGKTKCQEELIIHWDSNLIFTEG
jgi:hypothetical protein